MNVRKFDDFCHKVCDGLYDPKFPYESQCNGYKELRNMVINKMVPASLEEMERWENNPTVEEMYSTPEVRYLRFIHPVFRVMLVENWDKIKDMEV